MKAIQYTPTKGGRGWFRIYGYGLKWKRVELGLTFQQRYGYEKYVIIFGWVIGILKKGKG